MGTILVVLGILRPPLPAPDYHNVRHHDAPGEVCEHHDHLLRWHPGAGHAEDVAVFHWHWLLPTLPTDPLPASDTPLWHAHASDCQAMTWSGSDVVVTDESSRLNVVPVKGKFAGAGGPFAIVSDEHIPPPRGRPAAPSSFHATFSPHVALHCLLQHHTC